MHHSHFQAQALFKDSLFPLLGYWDLMWDGLQWETPLDPYLQPFSWETLGSWVMLDFETYFIKFFFSNFYVGRIIKSKAEYICLRCCIERPNRERKKAHSLNNCKDWKQKSQGMTDGKEGLLQRTCFLLHLITEDNRGCEVKWLICKDCPRTESNKFWASHLQSVEGMLTGSELALRNGQNSLN